MPEVIELERCYVGVMAGNRAKLHYFDGAVLEPIQARQVYPCDVGWGYGAQKANTGLSILADYFTRAEDVNSAGDLAQMFTEQFIAGLEATEVLFIEEFRIKDWLRVMRMLGKAA